MNTRCTVTGISCVSALVLAITSLFSHRLVAQERPFDTTACGLLLHPDKYDEGLVSVEGLVIVGPEEFTIHDASCGDANGRIWLQIAGNVASPGTANVSRGISGKPRTVEGLELPLNKDRDFDSLQRSLKSGH